MTTFCLNVVHFCWPTISAAIAAGCIIKRSKCLLSLEIDLLFIIFDISWFNVQVHIKMVLPAQWANRDSERLFINNYILQTCLLGLNYLYNKLFKKINVYWFKLRIFFCSLRVFNIQYCFSDILDPSLGDLESSLQINCMVEFGWLAAQYHMSGQRLVLLLVKVTEIDK